MTSQLLDDTIAETYMRNCQATADSAMQSLACAALHVADINLLEETIETWHDYMASWGFSDFGLTDRPVWGFLQPITVQGRQSLQLTLYGIPDTQAFFGLMRFMHQHLPGGCLWHTRKNHNGMIGVAEWRTLKVEIELGYAKFCPGVEVMRPVVQYTCTMAAETED